MDQSLRTVSDLRLRLEMTSIGKFHNCSESVVETLPGLRKLSKCRMFENRWLIKHSESLNSCVGGKPLKPLVMKENMSCGTNKLPHTLICDLPCAAPAR